MAKITVKTLCALMLLTTPVMGSDSSLREEVNVYRLRLIRMVHALKPKVEFKRADINSAYNEARNQAMDILLDEDIFNQTLDLPKI